MSIKQGGNTIAGSVGQYPLNEKNITNCITHIPQDIKLELNNGTLTLKAGSKVYVPNGAGVFDKKTTTQDITISVSGSQQVMVCVRADIANGIDCVDVSRCYSGSTNPGQTYSFWYDTTSNLVKMFTENTSTPARTESLPIAIITVSDGTPFSIDQVFNGFGYIGSTVFALPGVKGLIPDGRNADGSLKNITTNDFTTVKTVQVNTSTAKIAMYSGGDLGSQTKNFGLNEPENYNYDNDVLTNALEVARVIVNSSAKITAFTPKTTFHAVNYCDADFVVDFQRPTAANNYTWYRKYKSGWVEQGGRGVANSGITYVTLPVQMRSVAYTATGAILYSSASEGTVGFQFIKRTTKLGIGARWNGLFNDGLAVDWQVSGMAAN